MGVVVSGRLKGAVERNRVKRRLREIFRRSPEIIPEQVDLLVQARPGSEGLTSRKLEEMIAEAGRRISRGLSREPGFGTEVRVVRV